MTPTEALAIADKHVEAWLESGNLEEGKTLREHVTEAILEAVAKRDELWQAGNATLRFERDRLQIALLEQQAREERE